MAVFLSAKYNSLSEGSGRSALPPSPAVAKRERACPFACGMLVIQGEINRFSRNFRKDQGLYNLASFVYLSQPPTMQHPSHPHGTSRFVLYETSSHLYLTASDRSETTYR